VIRAGYQQGCVIILYESLRGILHFRSVGSEGWIDRSRAMQEPLRELNCETDGNVKRSCKINPTDAQFDLSDVLGRNSPNTRSR